MAAEEKVTIPAITEPPVEPFKLPDGVEFSGIVPPAYKDKSYMKDVTDVDSLFKKLDGAETLIGTRPAGIPKPEASEEDWNKFYDAAGRLKEAKDYVFEVPKMADGKDAKRDEAFEGKVKDIFHKAGLSGKQATSIQKEFDTLLAETHKDALAAVTKQDADFDNLAKKTFGTESDNVLAAAKKLIEEHKPAGFDTYLKDLPNDALVVMAGVINSIKTKYIDEDKAPAGPPGGPIAGVAELRKEAQTLMALPEYSNTFHPKHGEVKKQVEDIYERIRPLLNK